MLSDLSAVLKHPAACSEEELETFRALVEINGQASATRVPQAELLAFLHDKDRRLIAAGAIKNPAPDYQQRVFSRAGVPATSAGYAREVGFFSVSQAYQGKGLGRHILQALINELPHAPLFATTRTPGMARLLEEQGFVVTGKPWITATEPTPLVLYIRQI